jgi:hypothetical protein
MMQLCEEFESITSQNHTELKNAFFNHINMVILNTNERKADLIETYSKNIICLKCFDSKLLFRERKHLPYSALDLEGLYDVITCDVCDNGNFLYVTNDFNEKVKGKKVRYANRYANLEEIAQEIYHLALEKEIPIPDWAFMEEESYQQKMTQTNVDVDIKEAVEMVESMVKAYFADPTALASFLTDIQVKFKSFCSTSKTKKVICRKVDDIFILFDIEKESKKKTGGLNLFSFGSQTEALNIHLVSMKPNNKAAEQICTDLINKKIKGMIDAIPHSEETKKFTSVRRKSICHTDSDVPVVPVVPNPIPISLSPVSVAGSIVP